MCYSVQKEENEVRIQETFSEEHQVINNRITIKSLVPSTHPKRNNSPFYDIMSETVEEGSYLIEMFGCKRIKVKQYDCVGAFLKSICKADLNLIFSLDNLN